MSTALHRPSSKLTSSPLQWMLIVPLSSLDWLVAPELDFIAEVQRHLHIPGWPELLTLGVVVSSGLLMANRFAVWISRLYQASPKLAAGDLTQWRPDDRASIAGQGVAQSLNQMTAQFEQLFQNQVATEAVGQSEARFQQLAAALQTSDTRLRLALEVSRALAWEYDLQTDQIFCTSMAALPYEETLSYQQLLALIHPNDREQWHQTTQTAIAQRGTLQHEYQIAAPGQVTEWRWFQTCGRVLTDAMGNPVRMIGMSVDITERKQTEIDLRQSELKFATLFRNSPQPAWIATLPEGRFLEVNDSFSCVLGYSLTEASGKTCVELGLWHDLRDLYHFKDQLAQTGNVQDFEVMFQTKFGTVKTVLLSARVSRLNDQDCVLGVVNDISDRKQMEAQLRRSEQWLQQFSRQSPSSIYTFVQAPDGRSWIEYTSSAVEAIHEITAAQVLENADLIAHQIHPADRPGFAAAVARSAAYLELFSHEWRIITPSGKLKWLQAKSQPERRSDGTIAWYGVVQDISDRKQAEEALRQSEARFQTLVRNMPGMIYRYLPTHPEQGCFTYVSSGAQELVELAPQQILQDADAFWRLMHPDDVLSCQTSIAAAIQQQTDWQWEGRLMTPSGQLKWVQSNARPEQTTDGTVWDGLLIDITDRKQTAQELQQAKEVAEAANRAKSIFLANMSHELRTSLNAILGFSQLMQRNPNVSATDQEYLQLIHSSGNHLLKLINEILDLSKIEAGRLTLENTAVDLVEQLHLVVNTLSESIDGKNLQFDLKVDADVPKCVSVDVHKLEQILLNLLSNAIKFTNQGQIILHVSVTTSSAQCSADASALPVTLLFEIQDSGIGIAPEDLDVIFNAFAQAAAGQQTQEGTGLGLTISRRLVQFMGGEITVQSVLGQGSTFRFTLPVQPVTEVVLQSAQPNRRVVGLAPDQPDYRILVVDDQIENRLLLVKLFQQVGLTVREATTGEAALALWQQWRPHLIWMDVRLPELDGYAITQHVRSEELATERTVIIALTAQALPGDQDIALAAGCDDYLSKPFQEDILFQKMTQHLGMQFIYAEEPPQWSPALPELSLRQPSLTQVDLAVMPPDWVMALYQASLSCEQRAVKQLLQKIPVESAPLARGLEELIRNFNFQQITRLAELYLAEQ